MIRGTNSGEKPPKALFTKNSLRFLLGFLATLVVVKGWIFPVRPSLPESFLHFSLHATGQVENYDCLLFCFE